MASNLGRKPTKRIVQSFRKKLAEEGLSEFWDKRTEEVAETLYQGIFSCTEDELYLQEFLPYGSLYRLAGEQAVRRRSGAVPIDVVMQEHILLRDVFWEFRRSRPNKVHDFAVEKRICQCFNSLLQVTVQAYQTREPAMDVLTPLRDRATGVFNDVYFLTRLEEEIKRSERYLRDVAVILFEVDSETKDDEELAQAVARVLRRNSRASDILARVEAGKFAMILPETRPGDAWVAAERLKKQLADYLEGIQMGRPGLRVGLASYPKNGDEGSVLLEEAAENLRREAIGD